MRPASPSGAHLSAPALALGPAATTARAPASAPASTPAFVMAGLVPTIATRISAAKDSRDRPSHDECAMDAKR
jgi:hypothetical protein